jgi:hypothetical protein
MFALWLLANPYTKNALTPRRKRRSSGILSISPARPGDPLFDDLTAKFGVDLAFFGPSDSLTQNRILNSLFPRKALKPPRFENSHGPPQFIL